MVLNACTSKSKDESKFIDIENIITSKYWNLLNHSYKDSILILDKNKYSGCNHRLKFTKNRKILIDKLDKKEFNNFLKNKCEIISYGTWTLNKSDKTLSLYFKGNIPFEYEHYYQRKYLIDSISDEKIKFKKINSLLEHHIIHDEISN